MPAKKKTKSLEMPKRKPQPPSAFALKVIAMAKKIPKGRVATYGQLAQLAGKPGAARMAGMVIKLYSEDYALPWFRILNAQGKLSFPKTSTTYKRQKNLLQAEGIVFSLAGQLDLARHRWRRGKTSLRNGQLMFR